MYRSYWAFPIMDACVSGKVAASLQQSDEPVRPQQLSRGFGTAAPISQPPHKNPHLLEAEGAAAGRRGRQQGGDPSERHDHEPQLTPPPIDSIFVNFTGN